VSVLGRPDLVDLRTLTEAWRIRLDTEGLPMIPGRRGNVSAHDLHPLALGSRAPMAGLARWVGLTGLIRA
jgi:hypothetical protein